MLSCSSNTTLTIKRWSTENQINTLLLQSTSPKPPLNLRWDPRPPLFWPVSCSHRVCWSPRSASSTQHPRLTSACRSGVPSETNRQGSSMSQPTPTNESNSTMTTRWAYQASSGPFAAIRAPSNPLKSPSTVNCSNHADTMQRTTSSPCNKLAHSGKQDLYKSSSSRRLICTYRNIP